MPVQDVQDILRRIADFDFEHFKCKIKGDRERTACKTVDPGDRAGFIAGTVAPWVVTDRVADFQVAWDMQPVDGDIQKLQKLAPSITNGDLAQLHLDYFVPSCLNIEAGRHTCKPEQEPGILFYNAARARLVQDIRAGKFKWKHASRGSGSGSNDPLPGGALPSPGDPDFVGPMPPSVGWVALAAVGAFLLLGRR